MTNICAAEIFFIFLISIKWDLVFLDNCFVNALIPAFINVPMLMTRYMNDPTMAKLMGNPRLTSMLSQMTGGLVGET